MTPSNFLSLPGWLLLSLLFQIAPAFGADEQGVGAGSIDRSALDRNVTTRLQLPTESATAATPRTRPATLQPATGAVRDSARLASRAVTADSLRRLLGSQFKATLIDPANREATAVGFSAVANLKQGQTIALTADRVSLPQLSNRAGKGYDAVPLVIVRKKADDSFQQLRLDKYSHGFSWGNSASEYSADLFLAVHDLANPSSSASLATPVKVRIGGADLLGGEQELSIRRLGFGGEQHIKLRSPGLSTPVTVKLRSAVEDASLVSFPIDIVDSPKLSLSSSPSAIAGFGIESSQIRINSNAYLSPGFKLDLISSHGTLDPQTVTLDADGRAYSTLWSAGTGKAELSIDDGRFQVEPVEVNFRPPIGFIIACALGAALGAAFYYARQRSRHPTGVSIWSAVAAFLFSLVVTTALFAGFEIPRMLDLPTGRTGLVAVVASSGLVAILYNVIYSAMSGARTQPQADGS